MTQALYRKKGSRSSPKTVALREEFVALTHDPLIAIVLNQLVYWTQRVKDFDLFLEEERFSNPECNVAPRHGWIYKTANELIEETMICVDRTTMRRYLKILITNGWLEARSHPHNKWDKTSQYRLNLRNLRDDLFNLGFELPGINVKTHREFFTEREHPSEEQFDPSNVNELSNSPSEGNLPLSEEQISPSERLNSPLLSTENTHEIKNREHTQDACARKSFFDWKNSNVENFLAKEMLQIWEQHIGQKLTPANWKGSLHLTEERKDQLESLFRFHFQNDIRQWEKFCLRIKSSAFLMGGSPSGWHVTLDWILDESNLLKILEGNYDDLKRVEAQESLSKVQPNPIRDAEKAAILATITDPVWRGWCSQLAEGVRLDEFTMLHKPLSVSDLRDIANAHFLECEDGRLVWVGSSDQMVLNKIEDLRFEISWVFAKEYPKARAFRTRLEASYSLQNTGENHAE